MSPADRRDRGRDAFARRAWRDAFAELSAADREAPLEPEDLERLGRAAFLIGKDAESMSLLTRTHHEWLNRGEAERAARCAFWLAFNLLNTGQQAQGNGWIARARRILDDGKRDCVEQGYLLLPIALQSLAVGDIATACETFGNAAQIGERFGDSDLAILGRMGRGRTLINLARIGDGVALLDEVMISVTSGEVSPIVVGIVYCSVIEACYEMFDLRRAQEWTAALTVWCAAQPDLVPYRGQCLVRRAEIMALHGAWPDAMDEVQRACEYLSQPPGQPAVAAAFYQRAELHRLRGEFAKADEAYRHASRFGRKPQPGLARLRLAQGQLEAAQAAIDRVIGEAKDRRSRTTSLSACAEIALAADDLETARSAANELTELSTHFSAPFPRALAAHTNGAVLLAERQARAALASLRLAADLWRDLDAPYEGARTRVLMALAYRALGDADTAGMELDSARQVFEHLGAAPDLRHVNELGRGPAQGAACLTGREVQVLRLVATGRTNRAIAEALQISEKTVARHLSNIFTKLDLSSRAAATAYAFKHDLMSADT